MEMPTSSVVKEEEEKSVLQNNLVLKKEFDRERDNNVFYFIFRNY